MDLPRKIRRKSDGSLLTLQEDGKYTFDASEMSDPYRYTFERLMIDEDNEFEVFQQ